MDTNTSKRGCRGQWREGSSHCSRNDMSKSLAIVSSARISPACGLQCLAQRSKIAVVEPKGWWGREPAALSFFRVLQLCSFGAAMGQPRGCRSKVWGPWFYSKKKGSVVGCSSKCCADSTSGNGESTRLMNLNHIDPKEALCVVPLVPAVEWGTQGLSWRFVSPGMERMWKHEILAGVSLPIQPL